jgi:hypothetical protein
MADHGNEWLAQYFTPESTREYVIRLRAFAEKMRAEGDEESARLNDWVADNWERGGLGE